MEIKHDLRERHRKLIGEILAFSQKIERMPAGEKRASKKWHLDKMYDAANRLLSQISSL